MRTLPNLFATIIYLVPMFMIGCLNFAASQTYVSYEAEEAAISGNANIVNCNRASGGKMVRDIDNGLANTLEFQDIDLPESGVYYITLSYLYPSDRTFTYQLNENSAKTHKIQASGAWCFQGGDIRDFIIQDTLQAGKNTMLFYNSPIIDKIEIASDTSARQPDAFYVSSSSGNDDHDGRSPDGSWQTLAKVNALELVPGDSLYFKAGDTFAGQLIIHKESGTPDLPILISSYGNGAKPVIDGNGYLSSIHIKNSGYLHFSSLEIKNDGGPAKPGNSTQLRYGMFFENTFSDGSKFDHFRLRDLTFKNIYPTDAITDDDQTGVHAYAINTSGSWGDELHPTRFDDMLIANCFFTRTGRHAVRIAATDNLIIKNNLFEQVGGAGMVIAANSSNILVEGNITNYTGSSLDSRMAGRGSGIWAFQTKNLTVQHNKFMHARGIKDSFGMHIDIGNRNVVYQYNYSEDNEGGFVEILGKNVNVGYRYNLSVGDGWRSRGNQLGRIFWVGGWSGNPSNPIGSDSVFIYNNSVFVRDTITPRIWIEAVTKNCRIYNNIIYAPNGLAEVFIKNDPNLNDFDHNIWYGAIPTTDTDGQLYRGVNALTSDPLFSVPIVTDEADFILQAGSPAIGNGKLIFQAGNSHSFDYYDHNGGRDYFGNEVSATSQPNIGAANGGLINGNDEIFLRPFSMFPNPVRMGHPVNLEIPSEINIHSLSIQLIDLSGKIIWDKKYGQHKVQIGTDELPSGCYLIKLRTENYQMAKLLLIH